MVKCARGWSVSFTLLCTHTHSMVSLIHTLVHIHSLNGRSSSQSCPLQILIIRAAKEKGLKVTCEVCPHHLFLTDRNVMDIGEGRSQVRPMICTEEDQQALWDNMEYIDSFATDHG